MNTQPGTCMNDSAYNELRTVRDLLRYSVSQFSASELAFGHGSDNAWDEAVYLLLHTLHLPLDTLEPFLDARVLPDERKRFLDLVQRRTMERLPAAYLTGEAWLQGLRFIVDQRVIVPRSPIAEVLADALKPWVADPADVDFALDLCTGSGCLAIFAALAFENAQVDAVDISDQALEVADINIKNFALDGRVTTHRSDLFDQLPPCEYQVIVCNPPYVNGRSMQALPPEYRHEPIMALAGGQDGMELIRRIVAHAADFMAPEGLLVLEIGNEYDYFLAAFPDLEPVWLATENSDDQILLLTREQLAS